MSHKTSTPINESVMEQIHSGKVRMKPRVYYTLLGVISVAAVVLAGFSVAYLSSIIFFWLRVQTADTMAWGARDNLNQAMSSFPWWALLVSAALVAVAIALVRRQGHMYRHKTSTIALTIVTASLLIGLGLSYLNIGQSHTPRQQNSGQGQNWRQN